jgi:predicted RNA methylase
MRVTDAVLAVISAATFDGPLLKLPGQLPRAEYVAVAKVIEAAGGKWNRKAGAHVFEGDAAEAVEPVLLTGQVTSAKQEFGFFETPPALARKVAMLADLKDGMTMLEPSAGRGALVLAARAQANVKVDAIELYPGNAVVMKCIDLGGGRLFGEADFLATSVLDIGAYDRVLMNPPFAKRADIRHVTHALEFLKPGGRLVAFMSAGVEFREDRLAREFRDRVFWPNASIERLTEGSFKSSGTGVSALILTVTIPTT